MIRARLLAAALVFLGPFYPSPRRLPTPGRNSGGPTPAASPQYPRPSSSARPRINSGRRRCRLGRLARIWGDRIFLTAVECSNKKLETIAVDWYRQDRLAACEDGRTARTGARLGNAATATPAVDGERVYAYFGSYGLIAYDMNGNVVWQTPMPVLQHNFGSGTSPVLAGELVILNRQEPKDPFLVALDRKTGKEVWKRPYQVPPGLPTGYASYSTPLIVGQQVIVHGMTRLEAFDLQR